jgi:hypothetical protein
MVTTRNFSRRRLRFKGLVNVRYECLLIPNAQYVLVSCSLATREREKIHWIHSSVCMEISSWWVFHFRSSSSCTKFSFLFFCSLMFSPSGKTYGLNVLLTSYCWILLNSFGVKTIKRLKSSLYWVKDVRMECNEKIEKQECSLSLLRIFFLPFNFPEI